VQSQSARSHEENVPFSAESESEIGETNCRFEFETVNK